ncbi:MAG: diguanylate cyclase [Geobacter sp.]|nr:diguanylate cyclase [Geobacter sp.]
MAIPLRILIVDDSSADTELVLQEMRRGGYDPSFSRVDSESATSAALDNSDWDIIVVDNGIPHFDGYKALRIAREKNPDIPFIMLSSKAGEVAAVEAMKAGAHDYILKDNLGRLVPAVGRELQESEERRERRRAEKALEEHAHFMRVLLDAIPAPIFYKDTNGLFLGCNKAFEAVMGIPREQIIGSTFHEIVPRYLAEQYASSDEQLMKEQGLEISEGMLVNADGVTLDVIFYKATFGSIDGTLGGLVGTILDITERKRMEQQLWYVSMHDGLTGLYNRAYFEEEIGRLERGRNFPVSVVMADVDRLKEINDTHGHAAGDRVLNRAAQALRSAFRSEDVVARIGGDEFAALLPNADGRAVREVIQRIDVVTKTMNGTAGELPFSLSIGAATARQGKPLQEMLKLADSRMYSAKFSQVPEQVKHGSRRNYRATEA